MGDDNTDNLYARQQREREEKKQKLYTASTNVGCAQRLFELSLIIKKRLCKQSFIGDDNTDNLYARQQREREEKKQKLYTASTNVGCAQRLFELSLITRKINI